MSFIDFEELKSRVSIEDAVAFLDIQMKPGGASLRGACPHCNGGPRTLVVTPAKQVWYCFASAKGGDCIALVAHVLDVSAKDAAAKLWERYCTSTGTVPPARKGTVPEEKGSGQGKKLEPLSHLESEHEAVDAIGLDTKAAADHGIGYRTKGSGQGSVMIPFRNERGELIAYFGVQELIYIPPNFRPPENVVKFPKRSA